MGGVAAPPGWRDLTVDPEAIRGILPRIPPQPRQTFAPDDTIGHAPAHTARVRGLRAAR
jgi:hypothetical protein